MSLSEFKSCMLAALRSLLPTVWDTNHEARVGSKSAIYDQDVRHVWGTRGFSCKQEDSLVFVSGFVAIAYFDHLGRPLVVGWLASNAVPGFGRWVTMVISIFVIPV